MRLSHIPSSNSLPHVVGAPAGRPSLVFTAKTPQLLLKLDLRKSAPYTGQSRKISRLFVGLNLGGGELSRGNTALEENVCHKAISSGLLTSSTDGANSPSSRKDLPLHSGSLKKTQSETRRPLPAQKNPV